MMHSSRAVELILLAALQLWHPASAIECAGGVCPAEAGPGQTTESPSLIQRTGRGALSKATANGELGAHVRALLRNTTATSKGENSTVLLASQVADGLVGYWRFDDVTGTRHWRDDSPSGIPLVSVRTGGFHHLFAEGMPGAGLSGSGGMRTWSRSCAIAKDVPAFRTFSVWVKRDAGCCTRIINWFQGTIDGKPWFDLYLNHLKLQVKIKNGGKTGHIKPKVKWQPAADSTTWDHIAVTFSADQMKLFHNGDLAASKNMGFPDLAGTVQFKAGTGGPHKQFAGVMDELRLYSRALDDSEVAALAAAGSTGGVPAGESLPPVVSAGPALTMWKPSTTAALEGTCDATASWSVVSGPDTAAVTIDSPSTAASGLTLSADAPSGDYVLELSCSDGASTRTAKLAMVVFDAHEAKVGATIETLGPSGPFADAGTPLAPVGLWLFDGDLSAAGGGTDAVIAQAGGKDAQHSFVAEGVFGGALSLSCAHPRCAQLDLGNPEASPWSAMSVSVWIKLTRAVKNGVVTVKKGAFEIPKKIWKKVKDMDSWHHIVLTQDEKIRKIYLDGELGEAIKSGVPARTAGDAGATLTLGITSGSLSWGFDGLVDELAVYDVILSNDEVETLYTMGAQALSYRGTINPYSRIEYNKTMMAYFPDLTEEPDYTGYMGGADPSKDSPAAYIHPRIFFTPDELPAFRKNYLEGIAGRTMMENVRGLLEANWNDLYPFWKEQRLFTEAEFYKGGAAQQPDMQLIFESFRTLIDADSAMAARLAEQLDSMADFMQPKVEAALAEYKAKHKEWAITGVDGVNYDETNTWQTTTQNILLRGTTVAFMYDFIYPWLTTATRDKVRKLIATATQDVWCIGMDSVEALPAIASNWQAWVEGDLITTLMAIEGEDGFDKGVYDRAAKAMKGFSRLGVSPQSGATYEGLGKNSIVAGKLIALAKHGWPEIIVGSGIRKFGSKWLIHTMLPNGRSFREDMWGGVESEPKLGDIAPLKYAFPDDKAIDWVYRNAVEGSGYAKVHMDYGGGDGNMPYRQLALSRDKTYRYNCLSDFIFVTDWQGPADRMEHGKMATEGEPLTYVAKDVGLMLTRSAWADEDAAWMAFIVRSLPGGHASRSRGEFIFHALGETWAFYHTAWQEPSEMHSIILVDGKGQERFVPGNFVQVQDSPQGTFGSMDSRQAYGVGHFGGGFGTHTMNSYMLEPLPNAWGELPYSKLPNWFIGNGPDLPVGVGDEPPDAIGANLNSPFAIPASPSLFEKAYRTVGLVRAANPYALVFDDIQKDSGEHDYAWRMPVRDEHYKFDPATGLHELLKADHSYFKADGNDFILRQTDGGPGRILVRLLDGSSSYVSAKIVTGKGLPNTGGIVHTGSLLEVKAKGVSARFRMLLWPLKDQSSPLPTTSWDAATSTLTIDGDEIVLSETGAGATMVSSLTVAGTAATFETTTNPVSLVTVTE